MIKRTYITKAEREQMNDFQAGRLDTLCWLERQFELELSELHNMHYENIMEMGIAGYAQLQAKQAIFSHYLEQIKRLKGQIKNG